MVLEVKNISKRFGGLFSRSRRVEALKSVSFSVDEGEITAVLGNNGAGKTTLIKIIANLLQADKGFVRIDGEIMKSSHSLRRNIGYVSSDERSFFWRLTGKENLEFFGKLYGMKNREIKQGLDELFDLFGFDKYSGKLFRDYSAGMRKKTAVMRAMMHRPKLLLFDEVTNSLDIESCGRLKNVVMDYVKEQSGRAAVWCTHRVEEVGQICDKVLEIRTGKIIRECKVVKSSNRILA